MFAGEFYIGFLHTNHALSNMARGGGSSVIVSIWFLRDPWSEDGEMSFKNKSHWLHKMFIFILPSGAYLKYLCVLGGLRIFWF